MVFNLEQWSIRLLKPCIFGIVCLFVCFPLSIQSHAEFLMQQVKKHTLQANQNLMGHVLFVLFPHLLLPHLMEKIFLLIPLFSSCFWSYFDSTYVFFPVCIPFQFTHWRNPHDHMKSWIPSAHPLQSTELFICCALWESMASEWSNSANCEFADCLKHPEVIPDE